MSAREKNRQALESLFGNAALADRLASSRIAVVSTQASRSAKLLGEVLADCLARLWPNIDFWGAQSDRLVAVARVAAHSGGSPQDGLLVQWAPPYDAVIAIDCLVPGDAGTKGLRAAASGWNAYLGTAGACSEDPNPVGPAFAAALAAAQLFRQLFAQELADLEPDVIEDVVFDVRGVCGRTDLIEAPLDFKDTVFFGCGAVTHGMAWMIENWHLPASGAIALVDSDPYGDSNGQRYVFMAPIDGKVMKVDSLKDRLRTSHPALDVTARPLAMNDFCRERGFEQSIQVAVTGLDSPEARRQAALKSPTTTINMWTDGHRAGSSRYAPDGLAACLACDYLENVDAVQDETALVQTETNLQPFEVRALLGSPTPLTAEQARVIGCHRRVDHEQFIGQPLGSVLPYLRQCSVAPIQLQGEPASTDVPFAFSSLLAGIAGFMMLLANQQRAEGSVGWSQHLFKRPTRHMRSERHRRRACVHCELAFPNEAEV